MTFGIQKWPPCERLNTKAGIRIVIPVFPWWMKGYEINQDMFVVGWWVVTIGVTIAPLDIIGLSRGLSIRIGIGMSPTRWVRPRTQVPW